MANKPAFFNKKARSLTILQQANILKSALPNSEIVIKRDFLLNWTGTLKPTYFSSVYNVNMSYHINQRPDVRVLSPELVKRDGESIPHLFSDGTLCLFRMKYFEWNPRMYLLDTILPWTSLWLFYYEMWLSTGRWLGGGEHPRGKNG